MRASAFRRRSGCVLFVITLPLVVGCSTSEDPFDDPACERLMAAPGNMDATEWFRKPSETPKSLGTLSNVQALALVHELEGRGARRIVAVVEKSTESGSEAEQTSGLVVELPDDAPSRLEIFRLYARLIRANDQAPRRDNGQRYLFLPGPRTAMADTP